MCALLISWLVWTQMWECVSKANLTMLHLQIQPRWNQVKFFSLEIESPMYVCSWLTWPNRKTAKMTMLCILIWPKWGQVGFYSGFLLWPKVAQEHLLLLLYLRSDPSTPNEFISSVWDSGRAASSLPGAAKNIESLIKEKFRRTPPLLMETWWSNIAQEP